MKKAKIVEIHTESIFYECPHCGTRIRRKRSKKIEKLNYQIYANCHNCDERVLLIGLNQGVRSKDGKILCPECKKNKMCRKSTVCNECYLKNPNKYKIKLGAIKENEFER